MDARERTPPAKTFQDLVLRLMHFWAEHGCLLTQSFDAEKGAGTYNPSTFLRALGPEPWRVAYVEPSRRPTDGRYGENPNRLYRHHQFQVLLKPSPPHLQALYLDSLRAIGIHPEAHDIRFVEDNWESPTLGAWGLGWEVWVDGMEATQFTYFQQCGGLECRPVSGELTYGLERLAMYLQDIDDVYQLEYAPGVRYGEIFRQDEVEYSKFSFEALDVQLYLDLYERMERETERLVGAGLSVPAYDHLLHAAHAFNALDARGAISVTERQGYILRIRDLAKITAEAFLESRERLGFPLGRVQEVSELGPERVPPKSPLPSGDLLVEVGTEELPAQEAQEAAKNFSDALVAGLRDLRLGHGAVSVFATPRRLAVRILEVAGAQTDRELEVAGPPVKAAFKDGRPTKAAEGFARGQGVRVKSLIRRQTAKGEYLFALVHEPGRSAAELVPPLIESALEALSFRRRMRWGSGSTSFCRPVEWLVVSHGSSVLPARFAGVEAGSESRGHRFLAPGPFPVADEPRAYEHRLKAHRVIASADERRSLILEGARARAREAGGVLLEDAQLLDELTYLVEWPVPLLGHFDPRFLSVPKEVLISEMMTHQRYLPVVDEAGRLLPCFVVVANTEVEDPDRSLLGYRRVLSARFADGAFFFEEDQKRPLFERVHDLGAVRFHRSLGSLRDKVDRVAELALAFSATLGFQTAPLDGKTAWDWAQQEPPSSDPEWLRWALARAAYLAKSDLTTRMVFEFPELQGIIGAEYARRSGEHPEVAKAVAEHYQPRGSDDALPEAALGAVVGLADRFDTLVGIFANGKGPSGAADPYGLRRAALSILRILRHRSWQLSLTAALRMAFEKLGDRTQKPPHEVEAEVSAFFRARLKAALVAEGVATTDVAEAALAADYDDLVDAARRAAALQTFRASPDFEAVAGTFKRVQNILKDEDIEPPSQDALVEDVEQALYGQNRLVGEEVKKSTGQRCFDEAFRALAMLRPTVDAFFEGVLVMDEDLEVRKRRLGLLAMSQRIFSPLADFSKLS